MAKNRNTTGEQATLSYYFLHLTVFMQFIYCRVCFAKFFSFQNVNHKKTFRSATIESTTPTIDNPMIKT